MTYYLYSDLTHTIIGVYYDVYNGLGSTYPEYVYEKAMLYDLQRLGVRCSRQDEYQIFYKETLVGMRRENRMRRKALIKSV
ncbi:GxxExxY protein [Anaerolineales bacterium HSG25]|nr:GxxExxY protein [Anaerolineales bacterium HSG25]